MRGRLINAFVAEIAQQDTVATAADPDGAGAFTSGYDPDFKEPVRLPPAAGAGAGTQVRVDVTRRVPCQIEMVTYDSLNQAANGNDANAALNLVLHFQTLERLGFIVKETGESIFRVTDKLVAIYSKCGALIQTMRPPLYCTQVQPSSFGIGFSRNLLILTFENREQGAR